MRILGSMQPMRILGFDTVLLHRVGSYGLLPL